jgi:hypothetical protein
LRGFHKVLEEMVGKLFTENSWESFEIKALHFFGLRSLKILDSIEQNFSLKLTKLQIPQKYLKLQSIS